MGYLEFVDLLLGEVVGFAKAAGSAPALKLSGLPHHKGLDAKHEGVSVLVALAPRLWRADRDRHASRRRGRRSGGEGCFRGGSA
jgi:hypothetical protein